jgi:xanthine dehydrogenase YagT iron-sulfur-binding subunit
MAAPDTTPTPWVVAFALRSGWPTVQRAVIKGDKMRSDPVHECSRREFMTQVGVGGVGISSGVFLLSGCGESGAPKSTGANAPPSSPPQMIDGSFSINKQKHTLKFDTRTTLLDLLRENLHMTGSKKGCDHGQCGACTVLIDGIPFNSCLALAALYTNREITTIEGLGSDDTLHPVQEAFIKHDGFQCGYCTPGQIMSAVAIVNEAKNRTADEIRERMSGNICRCGAYVNIVAAVLEAQGKGGPASMQEKRG